MRNTKYELNLKSENRTNGIRFKEKEKMHLILM